MPDPVPSMLRRSPRLVDLPPPVYDEAKTGNAHEIDTHDILQQQLGNKTDAEMHELHTNLTRLTKVQPSLIVNAGRGLFANQPLSEGSTVGLLASISCEVLSKKKSMTDDEKKNFNWTMGVSAEFLDKVTGDDEASIWAGHITCPPPAQWESHYKGNLSNHSKQPNAEFVVVVRRGTRRKRDKVELYLVATKEIPEDGEITVDYHSRENWDF